MAGQPLWSELGRFVDSTSGLILFCFLGDLGQAGPNRSRPAQHPQQTRHPFGQVDPAPVKCDRSGVGQWTILAGLVLFWPRLLCGVWTRIWRLGRNSIEELVQR